MTSLDRLAIHRFQTIIGTWDYPHPPSYYYITWLRLASGTGTPYWASRPYDLQRESDQMMCQLIHDIYCSVSGLISFNL